MSEARARSCSARSRAVALLERLEAAPHETISGLLRAETLCPEKDRGLLAELVYGAVRFRPYLRQVAGHKLRKPMNRLPPRLLFILDIALYQLLFLERVPAYAIIWEAVETAKRAVNRSLAQVANGVLRAVEREIETWRWRPLADFASAASDAIACHYGLPAELVARWRDRFAPDDFMALMAQTGKRPSIGIRVNAQKEKGGAVAWAARAGAEGVTATVDPRLPRTAILETAALDRRSAAYREGLLSFQSRSSQIAVESVCRLLQPGMQVLDICAGAGGKSLGIAEAFGPDITIDATDPRADALRDFSGELVRLGLSAIRIRDTPPPYPDCSAWDLVLVDAPCSGLGTLQKNPELRLRRGLAELPHFAEIELAILESASRWVRPGARLLYMVCTVEPEETEAVVAHFLSRHRDFVADFPTELLELEAFWTRGPAGYFLYPFRVLSEGFFMAAFKRNQ